MQGSFKRPLVGKTKIDIVIPAIEKDLGTLPSVIDGLRKHLKHPIGSILIIAPSSERIKRLCQRKSCRFINENTVLPITKKDIHYRSQRWERSGWLFQQLLKYGASSFVKQSSYLVVDADTVFIRPHTFKKGGKTVFYCRKWSQPEYFNTYRRLLGHKKSASASFVTHYMLFDKAKLSQLKMTIEAKHGLPWYRAIIKSIDKSKQFGFSEYETYGNFLYENYPDGYVLRKALNKSLSMNASGISAARVRKLSRTYRSLSFHKRKCYVR